MELDLKQNRRLEVLCAGRGNRAGEGIYPSRPGCPKITPEQLRKVKELYKQGMNGVQIAYKLDLSVYIVRNADKGEYDYILNKK